MRSATGHMCKPFMATHLFRYLAWKLLTTLAMTYSIFFAIIYTVDVIEMSRRFSGQAAASLASVALLSLHRIPSIMGDMTVFIIMLATIGSFIALERRRELVVIRAMGLSSWQYLQSGLITTAIFGIFFTLVYSPMAAHYKKRAESVQTSWTQNAQRSSQPLWFEDEMSQGRVIIRSDGFEQERTSLFRPKFFLFNHHDVFQTRYEAERASLEKTGWVLHHAREFSISAQPQFHERFELRTSFTPHRLATAAQRTPEAFSFWELNDIVTRGKKTGFNHIPYELRQAKIVFQTPLFIAGFLIAATFSLGYSRLAHPLWPILKAMGVGFIVYGLIKMIEDMGMAGLVNPWVATMIMPLTGGVGAALLLIQKEYG